MNLQLEHITRKFHANRQTIYALQDFNLSLNLTHGIYAFVGPNGSGKTTLFKIPCVRLERKSTRLNSSHVEESHLPSSA